MSKKLIKLHDIFLRKFLLLFITIFFVFGVIFYFWIKNIYIEQTKIDLLNNIDITSLQITNLKNANKLAKKINTLTKLRVTIISSDGVVVGESHNEYTKMDNHLNRAEIIQSKYQEYGSIIRYSDTINKELLYVAKNYKTNEDNYFIRMSRDIELINQEFLYLSLKISFLFFIFMGFAFFIALKISNEVQNETRSILKFLRNLTKQTKNIKIESRYSIEFNKITKLLTAVSKNLESKDKQKAKYTEKLKQSNAQKDDIISAISHEFKNPIAVISGYTQTLLEDDDINISIRKKFLTKISANSLKMTHMIDRLRLSIKLESSKQNVTFNALNIKELARNIADDLKLTYKNRTIIIKGEDLEIKADRIMLGIAISNLIENALKYSQGNIQISINSNAISIIDSGIGINKTDLVMITNKFYRVSTNTWNNSLGVGLSLVKNIVDLHKFTLDIRH